MDIILDDDDIVVNGFVVMDDDVSSMVGNITELVRIEELVKAPLVVEVSRLDVSPPPNVVSIVVDIIMLMTLLGT